ncbi:Transcriptional regulator WhiB [Mycobacterium kansasii]|uniref:WhiB family transcriptional regulator n=1 Tax=Mycobacterium kansasii TaxID=1768 RepID=UPI000F10218B|nr:WhiB family transcriptional regulator [Mycobacterium kansasii]VAZ69741.1 Transcriptional regulator WhiB [Mycobacterium kansasii]
MNHNIQRHLGTPCAQNPADWLDPRRRDHTARACRTCPALARCAAEAERIRPDYGMWAGVWIDRDFTGKQHLLALPHPDPTPAEPAGDQISVTPPTAMRTARVRRVGALCTAAAPPVVAALITARASGHCEIMAPACTYTQTAVFSRRRGGPRSPLASPAEAVAACANCIDHIEHTSLPTALDLGYLVNLRSCASTVAIWWRQCHWVQLDSRGRLGPAGTARLTPTA